VKCKVRNAECIPHFVFCPGGFCPRFVFPSCLPASFVFITRLLAGFKNP